MWSEVIEERKWLADNRTYLDECKQVETDGIGRYFSFVLLFCLLVGKYKILAPASFTNS